MDLQDCPCSVIHWLRDLLEPFPEPITIRYSLLGLPKLLADRPERSRVRWQCLGRWQWRDFPAFPWVLVWNTSELQLDYGTFPLEDPAWL
jgi:hypothetical protein